MKTGNRRVQAADNSPARQRMRGQEKKRSQQVDDQKTVISVRQNLLGGGHTLKPKSKKLGETVNAAGREEQRFVKAAQKGT